MQENETDSVQNRFTAYLVTAVTNKRIRYMEKRNRKKETEISGDIFEKNYQDFDMQFREYIGEQTGFVLEDWERYQEFLQKAESGYLREAVERLKEREKKLLFARVFGELSFAELGELVGLQPKQAEMAYFYVIRKLRKELGAKKDEF